METIIFCKQYLKTAKKLRTEERSWTFSAVPKNSQLQKTAIYCQKYNSLCMHGFESNDLAVTGKR